MSERMSQDMSERMSGDLPERMSERMSYNQSVKLAEGNRKQFRKGCMPNNLHLTGNEADIKSIPGVLKCHEADMVWIVRREVIVRLVFGTNQSQIEKNNLD